MFLDFALGPYWLYLTTCVQYNSVELDDLSSRNRKKIWVVDMTQSISRSHLSPMHIIHNRSSSNNNTWYRNSNKIKILILYYINIILRRRYNESI